MKNYSAIITMILALAMIGMVANGLCQQKGAQENPQRGGILREIEPNGPRVLSYLPEMGPGDEQAVMPGAERLMEYNQDRELVPFLAESVTIAKDLKSITFKLRKDVKFHDGSECNAEAVAWNYQLNKDAKRLQYADKLERIEVVGNYTLRLHITHFTNQLIYSYGWLPIFSKAAWDKAGGGNTEKSKEWARANLVGTGPFKLAEYKRDNYLRWVRNENYWQQGKSYLDGIYIRYIPDPVTARSMMQAKEADMWYGVPIKDVDALARMGFPNIQLGMPRAIFFNTKDPNSKFLNKKVREAVEYALDKPAMAKALGFGYYTPLASLAPPGEWGYDPAFKGRTFNPAKAKQLLAEAGYPRGLKVSLLALSQYPYTDEVQAIKRYLDDVGIIVDPDLADPGRFFDSLWLKGWPDMVIFGAGRSANTLVNFHRQFGPEPMSNYASFKRLPELTALAEKSLTINDVNGQKEITKQLVDLMYEELPALPLFLVPQAIVVQPGVHVTWVKIQMVTRYAGDEWIEKK